MKNVNRINLSSGGIINICQWFSVRNWPNLRWLDTAMYASFEEPTMSSLSCVFKEYFKLMNIYNFGGHLQTIKFPTDW